MTNPTPPPEEVELDEILAQILVKGMGKAYLLETEGYPVDAEERYYVDNEADTEYIEMLTKKAKAQLLRWREAYAEKARIDEAENARKYFTKPVIELDQRISALRKVNEESELQAEDKEGQE